MSLAELTARSEYWAVRNLCRRRVVALEEFTERHEGRTVLQWAKRYQQTDLVKELTYFYSELKVCIM